MNKKENGFSAAAVLLILVVIGVICFTGWYVWQNQQNNSKKSDGTEEASSSQKESSSDTKETAKIDTSITDVSISLQEEADIDKLPSSTPASFKAFILNKLKSNTPDADGCITVYAINKISSVNIKGSGSTANSSSSPDAVCMGGAPLVWALTPGGTWDEVSLNQALCKSENGGLVYEEFAPECYTDPNTDSLVKNPNGSITTLSQ